MMSTILTFVCDDLDAHDWTYRDEFKARGLVQTIPTVASNVTVSGGGSTQLSYDKVLELQNEYGYEFGSHGYTHANMTFLPVPDLTYQLTESKKILRRLGLNCENFFYPYGEYNAITQAEVVKHYRSARTSERALNVPPFDWHHIKGEWSDAPNMTLDIQKGWVDEALATPNSWLVISYHSSTATSLDVMKGYVFDIAEYAKSQGVEIMTYSDALDVLGCPKFTKPSSFYFNGDYLNKLFLCEENKLLPLNLSTMAFEVGKPLDLTPPTITGVTPIDLIVGDEMPNLRDGITVTDNIDNNVKLYILGEVDMTSAGTYEIVYKAVDSSGNSTVATRIITVSSELILRALPDGTTDEVNEDGDLVRRVGTLLIDGNENQHILRLGAFCTASEQACYVSVENGKITNVDENQCYLASNSSDFQATSIDGLEAETQAVAYYTMTTYEPAETTIGYIVIKAPLTLANNANNLKNYFKSHPIEVWYPLEKPTINGEVVDDIKPVISGASDKTITVGDIFDVLDGITANDNKDGNITDRIVISGSVDVNSAGAYTITYSVSDNAGNNTSKTITVTVEEPYVDDFPTTGTIIAFNGTENWVQYSQWNSKTYAFRLPIESLPLNLSADDVHFKVKNNLYIPRSRDEMLETKTTDGIASIDVSGVCNLCVRSKLGRFAPTNVAGFKKYLEELHESGNPLTIALIN